MPVARAANLLIDDMTMLQTVRPIRMCLAHQNQKWCAKITHDPYNLDQIILQHERFQESDIVVCKGYPQSTVAHCCPLTDLQAILGAMKKYIFYYNFTADGKGPPFRVMSSLNNFKKHLKFHLFRNSLAQHECHNNFM